MVMLLNPWAAWQVDTWDSLWLVDWIWMWLKGEKLVAFQERKTVIKIFVVEQDREDLVKLWLVWKYQHEFITLKVRP